MNSEVARHAAKRHREVQQLLPWLLAGTLEGAELDLVQAHLLQCGQCRADLEFERRLRAAAPPPDAGLDPERALAQLVARMPARREGVLERFRRAIAANDGGWLRWTVAAQLAVIAVLGALLAHGDGDGAYQALGAPGGGQGNIVVMFRPDTPERELRRIVQSSGARVVDGPTVADAWVLDVPAGEAPRALGRLRGERAVTLAQALERQARP